MEHGGPLWERALAAGRGVLGAEALPYHYKRRRIEIRHTVDVVLFSSECQPNSRKRSRLLGGTVDPDVRLGGDGGRTKPLSLRGVENLANVTLNA
jgi:hypothetical protein